TPDHETPRVASPNGGPLDMSLIVALVATFAAGLFTGAAIYITFVEHPARMSCGAELAVSEVGPSYKRATGMQATLAIIGAGAGIMQWVTGGGIAWLVSGRVLGAVVPFTLIAILPTNHRLLDPSLDKASPEAEALLARWGRRAPAIDAALDGTAEGRVE